MDQDHDSESGRLNTIAANSSYAAGANAYTIRHSYRIFRRFIGPGAILELGPAEGVMTDLLATIGQKLVVVDGASNFCEAIARRHPQVEVHNALFEAFEPKEKFGAIVLGHVLEHVDDPVDILSRASRWLGEGGRVLAAVPNARSLHRQAAVMMGMLKFEEELNEADRRHGHRRVYTPETFRRDFIAAGYKIEAFGGYWLKPLSNGQIERDWSPRLLETFMELGERYPDIAGEIYVVATCKP
jgi:2-polyprenyl-3-methyl-5-hydroxy-6-metoxy-1,4-benzoquinol methylase